jgi:hypothetical protein
MTSLVLTAIALALFAPVLFMGATQKLIPDVPRPAVEPWGTNDPAVWQAELDAP